MASLTAVFYRNLAADINKIYVTSGTFLSIKVDVLIRLITSGGAYAPLPTSFLPKIKKLAQAKGPVFSVPYYNLVLQCFLKILQHFHDTVKNYDHFVKAGR